MHPVTLPGSSLVRSPEVSHCHAPCGVWVVSGAVLCLCTGLRGSPAEFAGGKAHPEEDAFALRRRSSIRNCSTGSRSQLSGQILQVARGRTIARSCVRSRVGTRLNQGLWFRRLPGLHCAEVVQFLPSCRTRLVQWLRIRLSGCHPAGLKGFRRTGSC